MNNRQLFEWVEITPEMVFEDHEFYIFFDKIKRLKQHNGLYLNTMPKDFIIGGKVLFPVTEPLYTLE